ncbi:TonB-dependent receptor [Flavihumibacter sp. R14]|nr:TonB-dependent receptor [Flavihumibacter soli]
MKKILQSCLLFLFILSAQAYGQDRKVSGTVTAREDGLPLPGVSVVIRGTQTGTQTDRDGKYTLSVPSGSNQLEFRFIGYANQTVTIGSNGVANAIMTISAKELGEVVVTGYGSQSKKEFTGSASAVSGGKIADKPVQSFGQALTGQAAGVNIVQPNGLLNNPPVIRVRGISSISLSTFPLVVVDGIPISTGDVSANSSTNNPLGDINPSDIESIDILKDAASTAIYGSRAAAGVLVITTKKGKAGQAKLTYEGWGGLTNAVRLPDVLDAEQYVAHKNMAVANALAINPNAVGATQRDANGVSFFANKNPDGSLVNTNWFDEVYQQAFSQNHNVSISGANDKTSYYVSGGLSDQEGFLKANTFSRKSGRVNLNHTATNWLKLGLNMNYNNSLNQSPNSGSAPGGAFGSAGIGRIAMALSPNLQPRNPDGSYSIAGVTNTVGNGNNLFPTQWANPVTLIERDKNSSETNRLLANLSADVKLLEGLTFRTAYSWDRSNTENIQFWNPLQGDGWTYNGYAYNNAAKRDNWNWINTLQFTKSFGGDHNVTLVVGNDVQNTRTENWGAIRQGLSDPFYNSFQGNFGTNVAGGNSLNENSYEAYLATMNYNYAGKYFVSANFRRDGNAGLAEENRWGNFGGGSIGWTVSEEDFFKNSALGDKISNLRFRASYGKVGNGNVGSYNAYTTYGGGLYGSAPIWAFNQTGNKELKWETSKQTNIGLDFGILNDRISFVVDYYNKDIDNLILAVPQAPSKGIPGNSILANVGSMYNKGLELGVTGRPFTGKFAWTSNLIFATNKNEVTALVDDNTPLIGSTGGLENTSITKVGYPVGSLFAVKTAGVNPANGRRIYINKAGEQVQYQHFGGVNAWTYLDGRPATSVAGDAQVLGGTNPTWYGGFNNHFSFGNFDADMNFTYSGGNYIYNGTRAGLLDQRVWNNSTEVLNSWKAAGDQTNIPRAVFGDNVSNGSSFPIDANVEKGDFLRLQTATLGYRLPASVFSRSGISSVRLYGQVNNAFLITGYTGSDPEISSNGNSNLASGVERNSIPQGRTITFGLSVGF